MITFTRSGNGADPWCDFAPHSSGWMAVWNSGLGIVDFQDALGFRIVRKVPTDFLRYLDADGNGSEVVAIGVGADNHAYLVSNLRDDPVDMGIAFGNFPCAVFWNGAHFVPVLQVNETEYTISGTRKVIPIGQTSQGIRQILSDDIIWGDETHVREVAGRVIHKYSHIGPVFAGQRNGPDHIDLFDGLWHTPIEGSAQPPKLTLFPDGSIGCCAATNHGAVFAIGPPWAALIPDTLPPVDPPPVDPPPVEPDMDFPLQEWAVVKEMHERFNEDFPATEDGARGWVKKTIEQLVFSFPFGGWCWKSSTPTNPPSKDVIARQIAGRFEGWDVLSAAGVNGPRILANYSPSFHDLIAEGNQHPIPVTGVNHLDDPDPPDPPDGDLEEQITQLREELNRLTHQLTAALGKADAALSEAARAHGRVDSLPTGQGTVDEELRARVYKLVGKLREAKSTSKDAWHTHSIKVFEGEF